MVFGNAIGRKLFEFELGKGHRVDLHGFLRRNADQGCVVSWVRLSWARVGIEFAEQGISVFLRTFSQMSEKRFDQIPTGSFESLCSAEICRVRLDKRWIEIVLTDQ